MKKVNNIHSKSNLTKKRIIESALDCFVEKGFNDAEMQEISNNSNSSIGSIYHHYTSKEILASAVYMEGVELYQNGLLDNVKKSTSAYNGIFSIIEYHINWIHSNKKWAEFIFKNRHEVFLTSSNEELANMNATFAKELSIWLNQQFKNGDIKHIPHDILSSIVFGPCLEYTRLYLEGHSKTNINETIKLLTQFIWNSISAK